MVPNAETGPLSEVVHPILSSVAVTPGVSAARAGPASAATPAAAEPANRERRLSDVMLSSQVALNPTAREPRAIVACSLEDISSGILRLRAD
jgi:hypothetical protein